MTDSHEVYNFKVTVTAENDGSVKCVVTAADGTAFGTYTEAGTGDSYLMAKFTNEYNPTTANLSINIGGIKTVEGEDGWPNDVNFTFYLQKYVYANGEWKWETISTDTANVTKQNIVFALVDEFSAVGTYAYRIIEDKHGQTENGITYDARIHTFNVVVTDNNGVLQASVVAEAGAAYDATTGNYTGVHFTNINNKGKARLVIPIRKSVVNTTGSDGISPEGYEFELYKTVSGGDVSDGNLVATVKSDATGMAYITQDYEYDKEENGATYIYTLKEKKGSNANIIEYDKTLYKFSVIIDKNSNGSLSYTITSVEGDFSTYTKEGYLKFVNTYSAESVSIDINISGTKTVVGNWNDEVFTFYLQKYVYTDDGGKWETISIDTATASDPEIDFMNDGDHLTFTSTGTYAYRVIEANHGLTIDNITYDATIHTFDVVVTDDNGQLKAEVRSSHDGAGFTYDSEKDIWVNENINFTNTSNRKNGSIVIAIQKLLENPSGSDVVSLEGYRFELYNTDINYQVADGAVPVVTSEGTDASGETFVYYNYAYDADYLEKTYYYKLVEKNTGIPGMVDSTAEYHFAVKVESQADGSVSCTIIPAAGTEFATYEEEGTGTEYLLATFTNTYNPTPLSAGTELAITVTKELEGREIAEGEFEFILTKINAFANGEVQLDRTWVLKETNDKDGKVSFRLPEEHATIGTYYYQLEEVDKGAAGTTYDSTIYYIRVAIVDNNGVLEHVATVLNYPDKTAIVFKNCYEATPVSVQMTGTKLLKDLTAQKDKSLEADMFSFSLVEVDENGVHVPGGLNVTVANDANGKFAFEEITYTEAGTYYYQLSEVKGSLPGITYDETVYTFKVEVTDDIANAQLNAVVYRSTDGGVTYEKVNNAAADFVNEYEIVIKPVQLPVYGLKELTGRTLEAGEFSFTLTEVDAEGKVLTGGVKLTGLNDADGEIAFGSIAYDAEGTYYYQIQEVQGGLANVTYDTKSYHMTVIVEDDGEGTLIVTPVIDIDGEVCDSLTFTNQYEKSDEPGENTPEPTPDSDSNSDGDDNSTPDTTTGTSGETPTGVGIVPTGDETPLVGYLLLAAAAVLGMVGILIKKRKSIRK